MPKRTKKTTPTGARFRMEVIKNSAYDEAKVLYMLSQGSQAAFAELYDRYKTRVFATAYDFLKSREHAQEILQETFCKVWTKREDFVKVKNAEAYIFTIARNLTINALMKLTNEKSAQFQFTLKHSRVINTTDHAVLEQENEKLLQNTMSLLTPQQQKVFAMSRMEGLSHADIANQMNLSTKTVKNHINESLKLIRQRLEPHLGNIALLVMLYDLI